MDITVSESQLTQVLNRLDMVRLEILKLRAMLLPEDELKEDEAKELEQARKELSEGSGVILEDLMKELR